MQFVNLLLLFIKKSLLQKEIHHPKICMILHEVVR